MEGGRPSDCYDTQSMSGLDNLSVKNMHAETLHSEMAAPSPTAGTSRGFFSSIPFLFMNKVIGRLSKDADVTVLPEDLTLTAAEGIEPRVAHALFLTHWREELKLKTDGGSASLLRALRKTFLRELLFAAVLKLIWGTLIVLCASYFIRALLAWLQAKNRRQNVPDGDGWILSCFLFLTCLTLSIALQQMANVSSRLGLRVRAAMCTAVYDKSLVEDRNPKSLDVVSLVATDCSKLHEATATLNYLWSAIVEALAIIGVLLGLVGVSALPGALPRGRHSLKRRFSQPRTSLARLQASVFS
jgi:hypothetical protein